MKKLIKKLSVILLAVLAFLGAGTVVLASTGYITWNGTDDYHMTLNMLEDIEQGIISKDEAINQLVSEKSTLETENKNLANENKSLVTENENLVSQLDNSVTYEEVRTVLSDTIVTANNVNGPKNKYEVLQERVNAYATQVGLDESVRLGHHGASQEDAQLEQAEKDMNHVREETENIHGMLE